MEHPKEAEERAEKERKEREVTEGSEESFPASDPPATSYPGDGGQ